MNSLIEFAVILPCYNEAENLPELLKAYQRVWPGPQAELVLVNNGSTDKTSEVLKRELSRPEYAFARSILVPLNRGYGYGVMVGVRAARGRIIGISHADMQCDPQDLFRGYDCLLASGSLKTLVKGRRKKRRFGPTVITWTMAILASSVLMMWLTDINAQPKIFHSSLVSYLTDPPDGFELDLYVLCAARKLGWNVQTIPVVFGARLHGTSKWAFSLASRRKHIWATVKYIFRLRTKAA